MDEQNLLLERIAALEKQVAAMTAEQQSLKEQISTVNQFISSITESQNFEQSMATIESMGKQVLDCGKAEFWCYDGAENKYFTNDENRGGRDWQIAKENMRIAAESRDVHIADGEAYIPIISNDKVAGILVASEKDGAFDRTSLEKFSPNGQIANTIDLSLKKEFEHQGRITDELTRLKNRQGVKEYAANTMAHNVNDKRDMCIVMCDIDHFKSINDTYGHDAGDTVLKEVAGMLQSGTRQGADSAFRWGGEEMVCVLNCDYDRAMDIAERLRQQIENASHLVYNTDKEPVSVGVTISMGVYQVKPPDKEITQENAFSFFESQLKFADELAYKAKETGRNKVVGEKDIMLEKNAEKENLGYQNFTVDYDTVELESEYLDFSERLDNAYDDFMYRNGIFNSEHIAFVDEHGSLPDDLNTAENRDKVIEYINIQLEKGSNLSESQKDTLSELKNMITEIKKMETNLDVSDGDLSFVAETKNIKSYTNEAQEKYSERSAELDEQNRNNDTEI